MSTPNIYTTNANECRFYPVQCTDEIFQTLAAQEGYVYFVTDKKKLYLGKNNEMIPMCANSGIFYGIKPIEYDNSGNLPDPNVSFIFDEIEGEDKPELNDLILNSGTEEFPDGCFYRVVKVADEVFETVRLTLQGTGSGGSGGGGGTTGGSFKIQVPGENTKIYSSATTSMNVSFIGYYSGTEENRISKVSFTKSGDAEPFYTSTKELPFGQIHTIDLIEFKHLFGNTRTTVTIAIEDLYGNERSMNFKVQIVELSLRETESTLMFTTTPESYLYSCEIVGATASGIINKTINYNFYYENNLSEPVLTLTQELATVDEGIQQKIMNLSSLPHGIYVMKVNASANISSSDALIESNELTHKIAIFQSITEPLLLIAVPDVTEQYTNIPIQYLLVTSELNKRYTLQIKLDGKEKISLNIQSGVLDSYALYFEDKGTYTLECLVSELALSYTEYLSITAYTGELPVIDANRDDLMLYLNPKGKSNNAVDRAEWKDYSGKDAIATLSNFHYGESNGWLTDEQGTSYLYLSSGASMTVNNFLPFAVDPSSQKGMTIEVDFELSGILDYDTELIKCIATDADKVIQVGFSITGDRIRFYNSRLNDSLNDKGESIGSLMGLNIVENKRIRVCFVIEPNTKSNSFPMCYTYLNGKLSAAVIYNKNDRFSDAVTGGIPARIQVAAADGQIKLYGIRFYSSALTDKVILNNFTASLPTLKERQERYDTNNVFGNDGKVSYTLVSSEDYNLQIPYMKITGGYATELESKWQLKNQTNIGKPGLPTGKKDYRLIDVEVKYPQNEYFAEYKDYKFVNKFKSGKPMSQAFGEKPSNGGAIMYAQGTSSMEYPVKNLRLRFKNESDWYTVRPDISPVEIICMKADYMESSGSHNTGAANLVDALYVGAGMQTPGQEHFGDEDENTIVTCIKGHPCLIFYSTDGSNYQYVGKYNLNLDKATPEPFGFNHDDDEFGYLSPGDKYWAVTYDDEGERFIGQEHPTKGGDYVSEQEAVVEEGQKINSIHCFEFLDNAVEVCNFLTKEGVDSYESTWYGTFKNSDNEDVPGWTLGFESRYPEDRVGYHDADALWPLASWINELYELRKTDSEQAKARFKNEYQCYLNKDFLLTYYLVTEALLMADSRVKNMMIATWGKENYGSGGGNIGNNDIYSYYPLVKDENGKWIPDTTQEKIYTNNYIFYPIFYDMDTMLGLDNTGVFRFKYFDEDTDPSIFNGEEILWNFVRDALGEELLPWYSKLEGALLTSGQILPYFNDNQANMANEAFYNGDASYKYIDPAIKGYRDHLNNQDIKPGAAPFLYAAQGDRSLMREWFIDNRIKFLRGKYNSSQYQKGDRIVFRWYFPETGSTAVEPDGKFQFTSLKTGYSGVKLGANGGIVNERFEGEQTKTIDINGQLANGTEAYILGLSNLTDLGDLSNKYMQKFIIDSTDVRLKHLTLGNPHKDYNNPYWKPDQGQSSAIGLGGCTYLETFNLQNCSSFNNTLNFTECPAIKRILLTGSSTSAIELPINGMLEELRLPTTITQLRIESHSALTDEGFSLGGYDYGQGTKIEEVGAGGAYLNDFSKLITLNIVNTPIDTYNIVRNAKRLQYYRLKGINWNITEDDFQYCYRNEEYFNSHLEDGLEYYQYIDGSYQKYEGSTYPESLYEKVSMIKDGKLQCIPVLEYLQTMRVEEVNEHSEALSGTITLDIPNVTADELEIYKKYTDIYPDVEIKYGENINVTKAYKINFYRPLGENDNSVDNVEPYFINLTDGSYTLSELIDSPAFVNPVKTPTISHTYEFRGEWEDYNDAQKTIYVQDGDSANSFSQVKPTKDMKLVPKFYAIIRKYKVSFYNYDRELAYSIELDYQSDIDEATKNTPQRYYMYKPDKEEWVGTHYRYGFKGLISEPDFNNNIQNPAIVDFKTIELNRDLNFYAYYEEEDARFVASPSNIFTTGWSTVSQTYFTTISSNYVNWVKGKITYPQIKNNSAIECSASNIEAFYCLPNVTYTWVGSFRNAKNLKEVYLPETITTIQRDAFYGVTGLKIIYIPDSVIEIGRDAFTRTPALELDRLPSKLEKLGDRAFYYAGDGVTISELPDTIREIGAQCFLNAKNVTIHEFPKITEENIEGNENWCKVGAEAFGNCAANNVSVDTITINYPWTLSQPINVGQGIFFSGYAANPAYPAVKTIRYYSSLQIEPGVKATPEQLVQYLFGNRANVDDYTFEELEDF